MTLHAIDERSSGVDPVLAGIFSTMRQSLGQSTAQIAHLIGTSPDMIGHLEAGRLRALPAWAETVRIVTAYGELVGIEVRPILDRIGQQLGQQDLPLARPGNPVAPGRARAPFPAAPPPRVAGSRAHLPAGQDAAPAQTAPMPVRRDDGKHRLRRRLRRLLLASAAAALLLGGAVLTAQSYPAVFYAAADRLPPAAAKSARHAIDRLAAGETWWSGGFRWIKVDDPRARKADRLPAGG